MTQRVLSLRPMTVAAKPFTSFSFLGSLVLIGLLCLLPFILQSAGRPFLVDALLRAVILAIAGVSLNYLAFTGGMISFGHAAFLGIGAYAVGICDYYGLSNGFLHLTVALGVSGLFALVTGIFALRTKGVQFIMITLAFSQVVYYIMLGIDEYGSDDGLTIYSSSEFPLIDLGDKLSLYWTALAVLFSQMVLFGALNRSRFGLVLAAAKENERRVRSSGLDVYRYKLVAYVMAGMLASVSGVLYANLTSFITPDLMDWMQSGDFLFIVTLGGMGTATAPLVGSALFVFLEEGLSALTVYWHFWFGAFLVAVVLVGMDRLKRFGLVFGRRQQ